MRLIIDYVIFVFDYIVRILSTLQLPGSLSLLDYILCSLILITIFKMLKGGSGELTSFFDSSLSTFEQKKYKKDAAEKNRKAAAGTTRCACHAGSFFPGAAAGYSDRPACAAGTARAAPAGGGSAL